MKRAVLAVCPLFGGGFWGGFSGYKLQTFAIYCHRQVNWLGMVVKAPEKKHKKPTGRKLAMPGAIINKSLCPNLPEIQDKTAESAPAAPRETRGISSLIHYREQPGQGCKPWNCRK